MNGYDLPPSRNHIDGILDVATSHHQRSPVEDFAVDGDLPAKPAKAIAVGFDLVSMQQAGDEGDIEADLLAAKLKLFDDHGGRVLAPDGGKSLSKDGADLEVTEGRHRGKSGSPT